MLKYRIALYMHSFWNISRYIIYNIIYKKRFVLFIFREKLRIFRTRALEYESKSVDVPHYNTIRKNRRSERGKINVKEEASPSLVLNMWYNIAFHKYSIMAKWFLNGRFLYAHTFVCPLSTVWMLVHRLLRVCMEKSQFASSYRWNDLVSMFCIRLVSYCVPGWSEEALNGFLGTEVEVGCDWMERFIDILLWERSF